MKNRIVLRKLSRNDITLLIREGFGMDSEIEEYSNEVTWPNPVSYYIDYYEAIVANYRIQELYYYVIENEMKEIIGVVNAHHIDSRHSNYQLGISIIKKYHGQGYGVEAMIEMMRIMFNSFGFEHCFTTVYDYNIASIRMQEKVGFKLAVRLPETHFSSGKYSDVLYYEMSKKEFNQKY